MNISSTHGFRKPYGAICQPNHSVLLCCTPPPPETSVGGLGLQVALESGLNGLSGLRAAECVHKGFAFLWPGVVYALCVVVWCGRFWLMLLWCLRVCTLFEVGVGTY